MRVLVACEYSGRVRDAFLARGHVAVSCDILDTEAPGPHWKGDVLSILHDGWDMMIAFPPCTHICGSGARWWYEKEEEHEAALDFVVALMKAPIERIAIENPVGAISTRIRKPEQIIQPWMFGEGEQKTTCLWLKNLPLLVPTDIVEGREQRIWKMGPSEDRGHLRSLTYQGIANAMAEQWGAL